MIMMTMVAMLLWPTTVNQLVNNSIAAYIAPCSGGLVISYCGLTFQFGQRTTKRTGNCSSVMPGIVIFETC